MADLSREDVQDEEDNLVFDGGVFAGREDQDEVTMKPVINTSFLVVMTIPRNLLKTILYYTVVTSLADTSY